MERKKRLVRSAICMTLIAAMLFPLLSGAVAGSMAQAKTNDISYLNTVFTKKLYLNTKKIGFGSDDLTVTEDAQTVKKVYGLLANMKLKEVKNTGTNTNKKQQETLLVLYKKNGNKKTYAFYNNRMRTGRKEFAIQKNHPVDAIQTIFESQITDTVAKADYPQTVQYPDEARYTDANGQFDEKSYFKAYDAWWGEVRSRRERTGYAEGLDAFLAKSAKQFLSDAKSENRIYSPLNVYMALGMLAELTDGNSRQQILNLLGSKDLASLRTQVSELWNANYIDDGRTTSILAASLWLDQDVNYRPSTLQTLANNYYASSYQGKMGSEALNKQLQNWLNEQTGGLLKQQASQIGLNPQTVMALATTVYFRAKWEDEFLKANTKEDIFHADAKDLTCEFMHRDKFVGTCYQGEHFRAVSQGLEGAGDMWLILPDEGVTPEELLSDAQAVDFLVSKDKYEWKDKKDVWVNLAVPKFDVSSMFELKDGLMALGVTDVFDAKVSDFSPMTADQDGLFVSRTDHASRVSVDEKGVEAAAFTVISADATSLLLSEEEIDFILDRPFLFAVTGYDGLPLFAGIVNQP